MNKRNIVPKKEQQKEEWERSHGRSSHGAMLSGVQLYRPLTNYGSELPPGALFSTPEGDMKVYDSTVRLIDSETWNKEINEHLARRKQVEQLALDLIKTSDSFAMKYLGVFFNLLPRGGWKKYASDGSDAGLPIDRWLNIEGYDDAKVKSILASVSEVSADGRPNDVDIDATISSIQIENETSQDYVRKVRKLVWTLRFAGIIFTGKKSIPNPDPTITSTEEPFKPQAKGPIVTEVASRYKHINSSLFGEE